MDVKALALAIIDMAEHDKGFTSIALEELISDHIYAPIDMGAWPPAKHVEIFDEASTMPSSAWDSHKEVSLARVRASRNSGAPAESET